MPTRTVAITEREHPAMTRRSFGESIIFAARLLDAPSFKEAFTSSNADLGVIASPFVHDTVIRHSQDSGYSQIPVEVKETRMTAWMKHL